MATQHSVLVRFVAPLVGLTLGLGGCVSNRLDGPIHSADGPPWIADRSANTVAALDSITHRVVMIGDAGLWLEDDPTLAAIGAWTHEIPSSVVFLGDNIYNEGLTDEDRERGEKILAQQLAATSAPKIVVPGNHDWGFAPTDHNVQSIRNQQAFVDGWRDGRAAFLPKEGCLGPATRRLSEAGAGRGITLVVVDPTPWINPKLRDACPTEETQESHLEALDQTLAAHAEDWVLLASHYPLLTGGPHGGLTYGFLIDRIVGILGWMWGGLGNTYEPGYAEWIAQTEAVMRKHPPVIYAAGHDHNLQVLSGGDVAGALVVSGAGAPERVSTVTHLPETDFAHAHPGFIVLDIGLRGDQEVAVLRVVENGSADPVYEQEVNRIGNSVYSE